MFLLTKFEPIRNCLIECCKVCVVATACFIPDQAGLPNMASVSPRDVKQPNTPTSVAGSDSKAGKMAQRKTSARKSGINSYLIFLNTLYSSSTRQRNTAYNISFHQNMKNILGGIMLSFKPS